MKRASLVGWARFDDVQAGIGWHFPKADAVLVARRLDEVAGVLRDVDSLTARGWWAFGFVAYEAAPGLDPALVVRDSLDDLPLAWFGIARQPAAAAPLSPVAAAYRLEPWHIEWNEDQHRRRVEQVHQRISTGDSYQCNLTTRMTASFDGRPIDLYGNLALAQGGSYNAYVDTGDFAIASASPELFFESTDTELRMRPMKGTAPRGCSDAHDRAIAAQLMASEKDRAENIMIVDLVRNDVARLATTGGVSVRSLCQLEPYETVYQLTSEVTAQLRSHPTVDLLAIFRALFPCGSVTGAPKSSTMRLIAELEEGPRGVYCGAIGMAAPPNAPFRARFSVAIRTVSIDRRNGIATYGTGGGITWASDAPAEYAELNAKAALLNRLTQIR